MNIEFTAIGIIHTPFQSREGMPIQPPGAPGVRGTVEIEKEFHPGLADLEGFSHIILLYFFHKASAPQLEVTPFMDTQPRGIFATRAPVRPNPIGLSVVQLDSIDNGVLVVQNIDVLDGTPLLDIKPYVPEFDAIDVSRAGWLEQARKTVNRQQSDNRFK